MSIGGSRPEGLLGVPLAMQLGQPGGCHRKWTDFDSSRKWLKYHDGCISECCDLHPHIMTGHSRCCACIWTQEWLHNTV